MFASLNLDLFYKANNRMESYEAEGNINVQLKVSPISLPEYTDMIENALYTRMKDGYAQSGNGELSLDTLKKFIVQNNIILAGGFLLGTIHNYERMTDYDLNDINDKVDMDFYVPCKNLVRANKFFAKMVNAKSVSQYNATFYCKSFLRRNGIRSVQTFYGEPNTRTPSGYKFNNNLIDIMAVRNARSPLDVVQNFDLTFCQIWYDGKSVWATHPNDVKTKSGTLQGDYVKMLIEGNNQFLRRRIQKYVRRGFTIKYDTEAMKTLNVVYNPNSYYANCKKNEKTQEYYRRWVSRFILHILLYNKYKVGNGYNAIKTEQFNQDKRGTRISDLSRKITDLTNSLEEMKNINESDGYDTDEYDISVPETYYPELNHIVQNMPEENREAWLNQDNVTKFHKCMQYILSTFYYSINPEKTPIMNIIDYTLWRPDTYDAEDYEEYKRNTLILNVIEGKGLMYEYTRVFKLYASRPGMDAITLEDDIPVYDLHLHTLDEAIGVEGLKEHLNTLINQPDKNNLPCYLHGCNQILTLDEIRSIVDSSYFLNFLKTNTPVSLPDPLLGEGGLGDFDSDGTEIKTDLGEVLRNSSSSTDGWGNIFHLVMCPFCLGYIGRQAGCTYVSHANPNNLPYKLSPFCKHKNIVKEIRDMYTDYTALEICIECGRPCSHHQHFDLNDPPSLAPMPLTATGAPDYSRCAGGGRREAIARIIAVRKTMNENPDMEPIELRRLAALAATAGASNQELLAQADVILAKAPGTRVNTNLNGPSVGGRRIGKICSHGYETYRQKILLTRKKSQKEKSKRTRKSKPVQ